MTIRSSTRFTGLLLLFAALAWGGQRILRARATPRADRIGVLAGELIPSVALVTPAGTTVALSSVLGGRPGLIIVASAADCLSCANYGFELGIVGSHFPGLRTVLIGSGPDPELLSGYFKKAAVEDRSYLDTGRGLLTALGVSHTPLVLLVAADGHILLADGRSSSASAQFPAGRLLSSLAATLATPPLVVSSSTPSNPPKARVP